LRWLPIIALSLGFGTSCGDKIPENAAALVNKTVITIDDLQLAVDNLSNQYRAFGMDLDSTRVDSLRGMILESMITTELLYQESVKEGFQASDADLEREVESIIGQYHDQDMFRSALTMQGLTEDTFRKEIARNLTIRNYIQATITDKIEIPQEEKLRYYEAHQDEFRHEEQVAAKHILLQAVEDDPPESLQVKRSRSQALLERARRGEDFSALAMEHSEGPSAPQGGDLGYFARGQMVKPFEDAAFDLATGEVSDIVQTRFGFHIIQVYDRREAGISKFEEVESSIDGTLKNERISGEVDSLVQVLKSRAKIDVLI
jgi:peptidyl-prolyl cis-trans isomerase C